MGGQEPAEFREEQHGSKDLTINRGDVCTRIHQSYVVERVCHVRVMLCYVWETSVNGS